MLHEQLSYTNFVATLIEEVPDLKQLYEEHIGDYDELLPHVFLPAPPRRGARLHLT